MNQSITLPIVAFSGKTKHYLNLNQYRNWHYAVSNNLKKNFKESIASELFFNIKGEVQVEYFYYAPDKRKRDLMNVVAVVDKFFQDALVERGCIEADDTSIVKKVSVEYKGIDKTNPRIEVNLIYNL